MAQDGQSNRTYVEEQVKRYDHDRYLTGLFAPQELRPALWALYAFHAELARVRETVSEPTMGEIRLQWWRDAVTAMTEGGQLDRQPVAEELEKALNAGHVTAAELHSLIEARTPELHDDIPKDWASFEARHAALDGQVTAMAAKLLGAEEGEVEAARSIGQAWGLVMTLRQSSQYAALNRVRLPEERMTALGVTLQQLYQPGGSEAQKVLLDEVASVAHSRLQTAEMMLGEVKPRARSAFLLAPLAKSDLKALRKADYDPAVDIGAGGRPGRIARLYWAAARGRF